ncbi:MmcQ/YjbR family DNA-binding protein [Lactiplantibacillus brownii]|uniref:MmcQ/YjbR family DNA-binding protein n=1 Tax=Lactiplantibacillus brownii TaxID=3069269 RepID=UPI0038B32509
MTTTRLTTDGLIKKIMAQTGGYLAFPFNHVGEQAAIVFATIKQRHNHKILAMVYQKDDQVMVDLKLTPAHSESIRTLKGVAPGAHFNQRYWTTITINATAISDQKLTAMIAESAKLTSR